MFLSKNMFHPYLHQQEHGEPLFSSHMLDLSEEKDGENIATCAKYFERMAKVGIWLEMEIGITGGEEDGVDNTGASEKDLYTTPEQVSSYSQSFQRIIFSHVHTRRHM